MTILDACVRVLRETNQAMSAEELYKEIVQQDLYRFGAKDPESVLRSTIRKHIRHHSNPRVNEVSRGVYKST